MKKGNYGVNPLLCACINPSAEILKHVLNITMEFNYKDQQQRKLVHYAAACQGSGPLEYLISIGQSLHEVDQYKMTPFMIACRYGRI